MAFNRGMHGVPIHLYRGYGCVARIGVPTSIERMKRRTFSNYEKLRGITFSRGVVSVKSSTFNSYTGLSRLVFPGLLHGVRDCTFRCYANLGALSVPRDISSVNSCTFCNAGLRGLMFGTGGYILRCQDFGGSCLFPLFPSSVHRLRFDSAMRYVPSCA